MIGIMTGSNPISSPVDTGSVNIFGYEVNNEYDLESIRQLIGICPQHDVLFLNLTVREHLDLYGSIKGIIGAKLLVTVYLIYLLSYYTLLSYWPITLRDY